jgi:hypothetical protein
MARERQTKWRVASGLWSVRRRKSSGLAVVKKDKVEGDLLPMSSMALLVTEQEVWRWARVSG